MFHPSGIGYCTRKLQYHYLCEPVIHKVSSATRSIFDLGHSIHDMLQHRLRQVLSLKFDGTQVQIELTVEESINDTPFAIANNLAGSADGVIRVKTEEGECVLIYEAKSISSKGWSKLSSPLLKHRMQTSIYAKCLDAEFILFEYFCKDNARSKWYLIERDEEALSTAMGQLEKVVRATDRLAMVPREGSSFECSDCPYLETCQPEGVPL